MDILRRRLRNQRLVAVEPRTVHDVVQWMGAVQAQDYGAARWAVAQRSGRLTIAAIDEALAAGRTIRTHVLRPTWHFVAPEDVRWMLALSAPPLRATLQHRYRRLGLSNETIARALDIVAESLTGGLRLTRRQLGQRLEQAGLTIDDSLALSHVMLGAEIETIVCSGGLQGKEHTYALLDEVVPPSQVLDREAAIAMLAARYFRSHGPATIKDFSWWSGLSITDARRAVQASDPPLSQVDVDGRTHWFSESETLAAPLSDERAHLLPNFDEYTVGYADRSVLLETGHEHFGSPSTLLSNVVVVNGVALGTWKRTPVKSAVLVTVSLFRSLTDEERQRVSWAADDYGRFHETAVDLTFERANPA